MEIPRHVFSVSAEAFSGIPEKLPPLGDLIALALYASTQDLGGLKFLQSLNKLTVLEIGWSRIGHAGAEAIAKLAKNLISLDLLSDDIGDDGARAIATLTKLTSLALYNNEIGDDGAKTIATLTKLKSLDLSNNKIGDDGANAIAALTNLTSLDLTDNQIGDDGAKAIATLTKLTSLDLSNNKIGDDGAKAIATLTELQSLDLSNNKIGEEGAKAILDGWSASPLTDQFRRLNLQKNGDFGDLLPKEVLETVDAQAVLATYRRFRNAEAAGRLRPLDESKLLVVGNEAVGKTSLLRYLIDGKPRDPSEAKTPGIATREKIEIKDWSPTKSSVHLNVWDFGGQEMMRGTHRFFLTARSLYLLVLEDRRQDDRSIHVWLKTIRNRGQDSPIIVVINKSDRGKQDLRLPEPELREAYSNIVGFLRTSCDDDDWGRASIEALRQHIAETIIGHANLKHVRDQVPEVWLEVKRAVVERAKAAQVLTIDQFRQLCEATDGRGERITDPAEQRRLLGVLHDLGTVVAYGLDRDAPAARREITLLDPNWLTGAVYRVLDRASSVEQEGEFSRHQLNKWLDPDLYPPERHEFILGMMQDEEIGLCFRLPDAREERYLVPEALPASARFYGKWPRDSLRFRYVYNFLPPGLVDRI